MADGVRGLEGTLAPVLLPLRSTSLSDEVEMPDEKVVVAVASSTPAPTPTIAKCPVL